MTPRWFGYGPNIELGVLGEYPDEILVWYYLGSVANLARKSVLSQFCPGLAGMIFGKL